MPDQDTQNEPVQDSPKVDGAVAVGENLPFQQRWWRFERAIWWCFAVIILADMLGVFGRGWLAHAERTAPGGGLHLKYERVERTMTPSVMSFVLGPGAIHDGHVQLFISGTVVHELGAQRISPQPATSTLTGSGYLYTFPVADTGGTVEVAMEPSFPGVYRISVGIAGQPPIDARIVVMP